eukprot:50304-Amphidinium_carterae.2
MPRCNLVALPSYGGSGGGTGAFDCASIGIDERAGGGGGAGAVDGPSTMLLGDLRLRSCDRILVDSGVGGGAGGCTDGAVGTVLDCGVFCSLSRAVAECWGTVAAAGGAATVVGMKLVGVADDAVD